jgi:dTDP-4-dehydrorhamnose reductase
MEKILLLGAGGQVGQEIAKLLPEAVKVYHAHGSGRHIDFLEDSSLTVLLDDVSPDVVINAVAMTNVDNCETDKERAFRINADAVKEIGMFCIENRTKLIHISTDYIFDGISGHYSESSPPNPINYYGLSKSVGEAYASMVPDSMIVRTSGVYGHASNFPLFVYSRMREHENVDVMNGYYSPIHASHLARGIVDLLKMDYIGIINIAGVRASRMEISTAIKNLFNLSAEIREVSYIQGMKAKRPYDSSLDIRKAQSILNYDFYSLEANIGRLGEK